MMGTVWSWLVHEAGLYRALIGWAVGSLCGLAVGWLKLMPWVRSTAVILHRHVMQQRVLVRQQAKTIDLLRTDTPGGLHDVVQALDHGTRGHSVPHHPGTGAPSVPHHAPPPDHSH